MLYEQGDRMKFLTLSPNILSFITTYKCTSACYNCCFQCNPKRKKRLSFLEVKNHIDVICNTFPSIKVAVFTGGECFLLGSDLIKMVEHAKSRSLVTRVVTNGYWARTYEAAKEQLSVLRKSGLNEINFSTGDDHCKYVPLDYISNGCRSSIDMGLTTVVNVKRLLTEKYVYLT